MSSNDAGALAGTMMASLPSAHLGSLIGPVYTTRAIAQMHGVIKETISQWGKSKKLLAIQARNQNLFPGFQFDGKEVKPGVREVLALLSDVVDGATISHWLKTPLASSESSLRSTSLHPHRFY